MIERTVLRLILNWRLIFRSGMPCQMQLVNGLTHVRIDHETPSSFLEMVRQ